MKINFEAPVRLTETLLPLLRATASKQRGTVSVVNVSSTSGRVARANAGGYSAAKFALAGWSDSLAAEERAHGVHVGLVLPGFVATEGFPRPSWSPIRCCAGSCPDPTRSPRRSSSADCAARPSATCRGPTGSPPPPGSWRRGWSVGPSQATSHACDRLGSARLTKLHMCSYEIQGSNQT